MKLNVSFNNTTNFGVNGFKGVQVVEHDNDYETLKNRPLINGVELVGDKSFEDLGGERITNAKIAEIVDKQYNEIFGG